MRANAPDAQHSIVLNFVPAYPVNQTPEDEAAARRFDGAFNRWFLEPLLLGRYPRDVWKAYGDDVPKVREGDLELILQPLQALCGVSAALAQHGDPVS